MVIPPTRPAGLDIEGAEEQLGDTVAELGEAGTVKGATVALTADGEVRLALAEEEAFQDQWQARSGSGLNGEDAIARCRDLRTARTRIAVTPK